jgi:large subunit ribosomal protein L20
MKTAHSVAAKKRKKKLLSTAKGYRGERSKRIRRVKETVRRAGVYAYRDRRTKKREFRSLWITRLNAAARIEGISYRELIAALKKKKVLLSRDILSRIASEHPEVFKAVVEAVTS